MNHDHEEQTAFEAGRDAALFDGFDTSEFLDCRCDLCDEAYVAGTNIGAFELERMTE